MKIRLIFILVLFGFLFNLNAQVNVNDSTVAAFIPTFSYAYQFPGGDMAEQCGNNSTIGGGLMFKSKKNILLSFEMLP